MPPFVEETLPFLLNYSLREETGAGFVSKEL